MSQLLVPDPALAVVKRDGETLSVSFPAEKRVYVGDKLSQQGRLTYRISLIAQVPTRENPTGIYVLGQSAKSEPKGEEGARGTGR